MRNRADCDNAIQPAVNHLAHMLVGDAGRWEKLAMIDRLERNARIARRCVAALALGSASLIPGIAAAYTYTNPNFGTSATFPARAFPNIEPSTPEGQIWRSDAGAELVVYAIEDPEWSTPRDLVRWRRSLDDVTYQRTGSNWAVVSGFLKDGRIFYERYIFRGRLTHSVSVRYPETLRDRYDGLLKEITESLRGPSR